MQYAYVGADLDTVLSCTYSTTTLDCIFEFSAGDLYYGAYSDFRLSDLICASAVCNLTYGLLEVIVWIYRVEYLYYLQYAFQCQLFVYSGSLGSRTDFISSKTPWNNLWIRSSYFCTRNCGFNGNSQVLNMPYR